MRLKIMFLGTILMIIVLCFGVVYFCRLNENTSLVYADKTNFKLVIDPGHGGFDGGAVSKDGTAEKDINLAVALELKKISEEFGVEVIMTRSTDKSLNEEGDVGQNAKENDLKRRKEIIEKEKADLTVSIHVNSYPEDVLVYGAQVFYPYNEQKRTGVQSYEQLAKCYGERVQESLEINISDGRERKAMGKNDTYLMRNVTRPFILVECGFLSNIEECNKLKTADYQRLIAKAVWEGINKELGLKSKQKIQIIQSANK